MESEPLLLGAAGGTEPSGQRHAGGLRADSMDRVCQISCA